jgi:hypothetical protein
LVPLSGAGQTEKGRKAFQKATKLESIHSIVSTLPEDEMRQLRQLLEKLWYRALKNLRIEKHPPFPPLK